MPMPRSASSSDDKASLRKASRMPSIRPIGIPSERYSGSRLASIRQTTLTGPPASTTYWNSRSILSSTQQHRREDQRADQRHRDRSREIAVDEAELARKFGRPEHHHLAAKAAEIPQRTDAPRSCRRRVRSFEVPIANWSREFMLKVLPTTEHAVPGGSSRAWSRRPRPAARQPRPRIALLSNPKSTGNIAQLPRIREYCADHPDVFHYEVEHASQIGEAMKIIARVRPKVLAINGGDGTVQAALTELYNGGHFGDEPPPVAVLPSGKTNLIALDLGARGDPIETLERLIELARTDTCAATPSRAS